ncbi:MAG: hypothetical protein ACLS23_06525 [Clostridioides difficile]
MSLIMIYLIIHIYEDILDNISKISGGEVEITDIDEETGAINTTITMKIMKRDKYRS